jgi:hypothetical protein
MAAMGVQPLLTSNMAGMIIISAILIFLVIHNNMSTALSAFAWYQDKI